MTHLVTWDQQHQTSRGAPQQQQPIHQSHFKPEPGVKSGDNEPAELDSGSDYRRLCQVSGEGEEGVMTEIRDLSQVERGIETALRNFAGKGANGGSEVPDITAAERIDKIGNMSALAIVEASETTAKDIEAAAQAAVEIAADIMEEARQLATELRENGKKMSE